MRSHVRRKDNSQLRRSAQPKKLRAVLWRYICPESWHTCYITPADLLPIGLFFFLLVFESVSPRISILSWGGNLGLNGSQILGDERKQNKPHSTMLRQGHIEQRVQSSQGSSLIEPVVEFPTITINRDYATSHVTSQPLKPFSPCVPAIACTHIHSLVSYCI